MTLYEFVFLGSKDCLGFRVAQYFENLLVVNQMAGKAANQGYGFVAYRFDKGASRLRAS